MTAKEMNERLSAAKQQKIKVYPCRNLRASNIGHPCERYLYLLIEHWDEQEPHDVGLQNIFDLGNTLEEHTIKNLKEAGYEVITPTQYSFQIKQPYVTGREDLRIRDENGELIPVEVKGISPFEFDRLNTIEDFFRSKKYYIRQYPAQLQIYMYHFNKLYGFFALTNKLTGQTKMIRMDFDWDLADELLKKAEYIYQCLESKTVPDAVEDAALCEGCSLAHVCGQCKRIPTDLELDGELDDLIRKKYKLKTAVDEYSKIDQEIKQKVGEREKILTGEYLITRTQIHKKAYTVHERVENRISIKKL
ncbi:MAG: Dna2/Cas4 domain-containing protein [bacterium]|nr:Dna2/Cas4 domain-containing protein [bacterium]